MIDAKYLTDIKDMIGEDDEDTQLLRQMHLDAQGYIDSFSWTKPKHQLYFGYGIGSIIALFLLKFDEPQESVDQEVWIVTGDLPSAYFVIDFAPNPKEALETYCELMEDWIDAVLNKEDLDKVFPVNTAPTLEHANMLITRIKFIQKEIIPNIN